MRYPLRYYTNPLQGFCSLLLQAAEDYEGDRHVLELLGKTEPEQTPARIVTCALGPDEGEVPAVRSRREKSFDTFAPILLAVAARR